MTNINFPLILNETLELGKNAYVGVLSIKDIATLMNEEILNSDRNNINEENVNEIKELLLVGKLINTTLRISMQDENLVEFNPNNNTLVLLEDTTLNIVDGYSRCLASQQAYNLNPNIDFKFSVEYIIYNIEEMKAYKEQLEKATPVSRNMEE